MIRTSLHDHTYNCIAWAAGNSTMWWDAKHYWPRTAPKKTTVAAVMKIFQDMGYQECDTGVLEPGFEKIAIYRRSRKFTHVARQLSDGTWTSKLGKSIDVSHSLDELEDDPQLQYGRAAVFLKR